MEIGEADSNLEDLQKRVNKTESAIEKSTAVANAIGTEAFSGPEKYIPPKEGEPDYLKKLIATTLESSKVKDALMHDTLPSLRALHENLKRSIERRQALLSDAAEYQMNLNQLREYQEKGSLTNENVIGLVEQALARIQEELGEKLDLEKKESPQEPTQPAPAKPELTRKSQHSPIDERGLRLLEHVVAGSDLDSLKSVLNEGRRLPITRDGADKLINGVFTKLFHRVHDGEATPEEEALWKKIAQSNPQIDPVLAKEDFHAEIRRYLDFGPKQPETPKQEASPKPERRVQKPAQKAKKERTPPKPFNAYELVDQTIERIKAKNGFFNMYQTFKPNPANEYFGFNSEDSDWLQDEGIIKLDDANDHHKLFSFEDGLTVALLKNKMLSPQQREEIQLAILDRVEQWKKDNPPSAK